jgi:hypothetical protein
MSLRQGLGALIALPQIFQVFEALPGTVVRQIFSQESAVWCWAACVEMVCKAHGLDLSQCQIATIALEKACCPDPKGCSVPLPPDKIEALWRNNKIGHPNATFVDDLLTLDVLAEALKKGVVEIWLGEKRKSPTGKISGSGHVLLVTAAIGDRLTILDSNPESPRREVAFAELNKNALSYGAWVGSWIGI